MIRVNQCMPATNPNDPLRVESDYDEETPPSIAIVRAIAVIEDVDPVDSPTELGITLYDHIDPTALDQFLTDRSDGTTVTIDLTIHNHHRYTVRVQNTGHLVVEKDD